MIARLAGKLLLVHWKRFAAFLALGALLCAAAGLTGRYLLYSGTLTGPITLILVDEDDTVETRLAYGILSGQKEYENLLRFQKMERQQAMEQAAAGGAAAVVLVPEGFTRGVLYGSNHPLTIYYNEKTPLQSRLIGFFADSYLDMLKSGQRGVYAALDYARVQEDGALYEEAFRKVNLAYLRRVSARNSRLETRVLSATGRAGALAYYAAHAAVLLLGSCTALFFDLFGQFGSPDILLMLHRAKRGPMATVLGLEGAVAAAYGVLGAAAAGIWLINGGHAGVLLALPAVLWMFAAACLFTVLLFGSSPAGPVGAAAASLAAWLLSGGVVPLEYMASRLSGYAVLFPNYWAARLLLAAGEGKGDPAALLATVGWGVAFTAGAYGRQRWRLRRTAAGAGLRPPGGSAR